MMMFPGIEFDNEDYAQLKMTLMLYDDFIMAEKFKNGNGQGKFLVDPVDLGSCLANMTISSGVLPRNCLFWDFVKGSAKIGVYVEPKIWGVSVKGYRETWHVPLPGFVFIGYKRSYKLYAVKDSEVSADSLLYMAPVSNVNESVCVGNVPFPEAGNDTIWEAVDLFFSSGFNNHLSNNKSKNWPSDILGLWKELNDGGFDEYPVDDLLPLNKKLNDVVGVSYYG